jgi:hypothetical protein
VEVTVAVAAKEAAVVAAATVAMVKKVQKVQKEKNTNSSNRYFQKYRFFVHSLLHKPIKMHVCHSSIYKNIGKNLVEFLKILLVTC